MIQVTDQERASKIWISLKEAECRDLKVNLRWYCYDQLIFHSCIR
jgi:hypothetical protein